MDRQAINKADPEIAKAIENEIARQKSCLNLIASENFASPAILETAGSVLTNKYSEGYPQKRYYGGNQFIDVCEGLAMERAKKLFGADHANVQPHSGSSANMAAYFALTDWLKRGKKILSMALDQGGHLTHGSPVNFSGKLFEISFYGVDKKTQRIDYDALRDKALQEKPTIILSGATAYPREIDFEKFGQIAKEAGAFHLADIAHIAGLIVAGVHQSPVPYADVVTTTTHKTLRGPRGAIILCKKEHANAVDKAVFPGLQGGPLEHIIAAKAVCLREASTPEFREYQKQIVKNAKALAEELMANGLTLVSEGTDNHLLLVDVSKINLNGKQAETLLDEVNITVNKNMIPYDDKTPWEPSGIRIGTPALTSRGMKEPEMKLIAKMIASLLKNPQNEQVKSRIKVRVKELCQQFPIYVSRSF